MMVRNSQAQKLGRLQRAGSMALLSLGLLTGTLISVLPEVAANPSPSPVLAQQSSTSQKSPRVIRVVQRDLARRLNVPAETLTVVAASRQTWPDGCLGLAAPNQRCTTATVEGWRIELTDGKQNWVYRTDMTARVIKLETDPTAGLPPQVVDRLFEAIARQTRVPANTLKVLDSQPAFWDGCMGIYEPRRPCTRIAIMGYRVIVMGDRQNWVYHVSEDGSRIVQNVTASGSDREIFPAFLPKDAPLPVPPSNVVFRTLVSGGLTGSTTETALTFDGVIYQETTGRLAGAPRKIIKRISQQQVKQFQQLFEQQRVPNLNGILYNSAASLADYPTTTIQTRGVTFSYVDLNPAALPPALQRIHAAWKELSE